MKLLEKETGESPLDSWAKQRVPGEALKLDVKKGKLTN